MKYDGKEFTNYTLKDNLIHFHVFSVYEDKSDVLWFGTVRGGMYRYDGNSFKLFTMKDGLAGNTTNCMYHDAKGRLWFGTDEGLSILEADGTFSNFDSKDGLADNTVRSIAEDSFGKIWVGTDAGINQCSAKASSAEIKKQKFSEFKDRDGQAFDKVWLLFYDKSSNMWISGSKGLCKFDGTKLSDYILSTPVMYLCEGSKGDIWTASSKPELNKINNFSLYRYDGNKFNKIMDDPSNWSIFGMTVDKNNNLWFGHGKGVCRLDPTKIDNPCLKKTCSHNLPMREAIAEHEKNLTKSYESFKK
jgi:ligand-binding sensor domain-containing protein